MNDTPEKKDSKPAVVETTAAAATPAAPAAAKPAPAKAPEKAAKPAPKVVAKTRAKAAAPAKPKASPSAVKAVAAAEAKKEAKPAKAKKPAEVEAKPKKAKLVRDSFTIPKDEFDVLVELKQRAQKLTHTAKKSEILRAGVRLLASQGNAAFLAALTAVPSIKTGRPKQEATATKPAAAAKKAKA